MIVIKRDGRRVEFDNTKIINAIDKARQENDTNITMSPLLISIYKELHDNITVEEIQDIIEHKLIEFNYPDVAKSFILYRHNRTIEREKKNRIIQAVTHRINATDVANSNANVDEASFSGREKEASGDIQKIIALDYNMSEDVARGVKEGYIYQHDLDKYNLGEHNCLFADFQKLFKNGFNTRNGDVRPPKSFSSAAQQTAVIMQCQSQVMYGGVASMHLDYDLAPFVLMSFKKHFRDGLYWAENYAKSYADSTVQYIDSIESPMAKKYDKAYRYAMTKLNEEMAQSCEALFHNLNTLESRQGSQVNKVAC